MSPPLLLLESDSWFVARMRLVLSLLLLLASCAAPRASLPVFSPGPFTNLGFDSRSDAANTNASLHALWSVGLGTFGYLMWGREGLRYVCAAWSADAVVSEAFFHAPPGELGPAYASEVRTDLMSKILPCVAMVAIEAFRPPPAK